MDRACIQTGDGTVVRNAEYQTSAAAAGKCHQFGGKTVGVGDVFFELMPGVFAATNQQLQFGFGHGDTRALDAGVNARCRWHRSSSLRKTQSTKERGFIRDAYDR